MKNRFWIYLISLLLIFPAFGITKEPPRRGLFVSVIQEPQTLSSRAAIEQLINFSKRAKIDTLFVQIYRANKTWFSSKVGDSAPAKACYKSVGEDPFRLLINRAHAAGIEVHAWLNLLSLSQNAEAPILKKYGPGILTRKPGEKKTLEDYKIDNQYFLEPGDTRVRGELSILIEEILRAYPELDGLQFDYVRYPDSKPFYGYTEQNIEHFKKSTGETLVEESNPVWKEWRRNQVTELVEILTHQARAIRPKIQVSTTGCAPYVRAYHEAFQDWASWLDRGLVDFVTMMSYPPDRVTFEKYVSIARGTAVHFEKVNLGVGAYKLMKEPVIFEAVFHSCEKSGGRGCVVFHYGSLLENPALADPLISEKGTGS